jgi:hypothetical protein
MTSRLLLCTCAALLLCSLGCDPMGRDDECKNLPVNAQLVGLFYWGDWSIPNRGYTLGGVANPVWAEPGRIFVSTGYLRELTLVEGIFAIDFLADRSQNFPYRNFSAHESSYHFWTLEYDAARGRILFIALDPEGPWVGSLVFQDPSSETRLVGPESQPWGVAAWPGRPGIVFYGTDPQSGVAGFYWHAPEVRGTRPDSLLYAVTLSRSSARGMAIDCDGQMLFFAISGSVTRFMQFDLQHPSEGPVVLAERRGSGGAIHTNPRHFNLVLLEYAFPGDATIPPQDHIELFDVLSLQARDLDVRTNGSSCNFSVSDHASWSPDGDDFAYTSGHWNGEGGHSQMTLYICKQPRF